MNEHRVIAQSLSDPTKGLRHRHSPGLYTISLQSRRQNDDEIDRLNEKVGLLREISVAIGREAKEHNQLLDTMESDMGNTQGLMGTASAKLTHMMNTGGSAHMCYLACFMVFVFLVIYWMMSRGSDDNGG